MYWTVCIAPSAPRSSTTIVTLSKRRDRNSQYSFEEIPCVHLPSSARAAMRYAVAVSARREGVDREAEPTMGMERRGGECRPCGWVGYRLGRCVSTRCCAHMSATWNTASQNVSR